MIIEVDKEQRKALEELGHKFNSDTNDQHRFECQIGDNCYVQFGLGAIGIASSMTMVSLESLLSGSRVSCKSMAWVLHKNASTWSQAVHGDISNSPASPAAASNPPLAG
jgi:hypothetical protein